MAKRRGVKHFGIKSMAKRHETRRQTSWHKKSIGIKT
ncbi:hypothetical protein CCACVL1_03204 [Corchorus capsularis]|uniref:Uncharacterized protein n=1 Tax=Corchorus capsularis TaxID=210143 RepID=A0A1R3K1Q0_COCAP|nr:hypothetical protein CCACVL1_03204 [Corchorus capsularis]